jgi:hypothetical protein
MAKLFRDDGTAVASDPPSDLTLGGPPVHAWPKDPKLSVVRKGSRLNELVLIRHGPGELDETSRSRSADGIVAYSLICTSSRKRAGRVRTGTPPPSCTSARDRPRLAHSGCSIRRKSGRLAGIAVARSPRSPVPAKFGTDLCGAAPRRSDLPCIQACRLLGYTVHSTASAT